MLRARDAIDRSDLDERSDFADPSMRFLLIQQFFPGPVAPGPMQPRRLVGELVARGHRVDVIACDLNAYNEQQEPEECFESPGGGVGRVHRLPVARGLRRGLSSRLRIYGRFAIAANRRGLALGRPDAVIGSIQPLFSGVAARRLARRFRVPFLLEVRDLWPDALVVRRLIPRWQGWVLERLARSCYFGADRVVCLTPGLKQEILRKGVPAERVDLFPNAFDEELFRIPPGTRERVRAEHGWNGSFVAIYTGVHTSVTAIECIVRAAAELRSRPDIRLDLFGYGQTKASSMALAGELGLSNIHFHDPVPKIRVPELLAGADAGIMTLFRSPLVHIYFENKLIDYLAAGLPVVAAMDGVQPRLLEREGAGRAVPSLDHEGLARVIRETADDPNRAAMGAAGRAFITTSLTQRTVLRHYADTLEALATGTVDRRPVWDPLALS